MKIQTTLGGVTQAKPTTWRVLHKRPSFSDAALRPGHERQQLPLVRHLRCSRPCLWVRVPDHTTCLGGVLSLVTAG